MRPLKIIVDLLVFFGISNAASIQYYASDEAELVHSAASPSGVSVSSSFVNFQSELASVFLLNEGSTTFQEDDDILIVPKDQLNERVLNSLGFKDLVKYAKKFKLSNNAFKSNLDILVPQLTSPYFVFNTSDPLRLPKDHSSNEYTNFIEGSAPFELPEFSSLIDYFLVLPIPQGFNPRSLQSEVISTKSESLPIFKQTLSSNSPLLVFLFKSGNDVAEAKELNIPLLNVKQYLGSKELNQFFDHFAKSWIQDIGITQLVHASFCTLNLNDTNDSFCIKVKEDMRNLLLFPAFKKGLQKNLNKRDQVHSPKSTSKTHSDDSFSDYVLIPLSLLKSNITESFEAYSPRGKGYTQVVSKLKSHSLPKKKQLFSKRKHSDDEFTKANIEYIRDKLEHRLKQKKVKDKKIKDNKSTYVKSKAVDAYLESESGTDVRKSVIKTPTKTSKKVVGGDKFVQENKQSVQDWESKRVKQTVERIQSNSQLTSAPKTPEEQGCEQITWFNVFHHSVFGKTKFCGIDS